MIENASDALLQALLGAAVEGIVVIDDAATILLFSKGAQRLFGYSAEEVIGRNVHMLMPEPYHSEHDSYVERYVRTGEARIIGIGREVVAQHRNGETFPIDLSVGAALLDNRKLFVGIMRDLRQRTLLENELTTERERGHELERRLTHVQRISTLGEMAAGIAHEINQPLSAISTYADAGQRLADQETPDRSKLEYAMRCISGQARRAGEVVQRMRDLARQTDTPRVSTSVNELVTDLLILLKMEARASDAPIGLDLCNRDPLADVDPVQIQQVVINLVHNGLESMIKRSQAERGIRITTKTQASTVELAVIDHGEGVPADHVDTIFLPFETTKSSGMGIGLSICRTIVERHGGRLWYEPNPEGGSRFAFTLPRTAETTT